MQCSTRVRETKGERRYIEFTVLGKRAKERAARNNSSKLAVYFRILQYGLEKCTLSDENAHTGVRGVPFCVVGVLASMLTEDVSFTSKW